MAPFSTVTVRLAKDLGLVNKYMKKHAQKFPEDGTPDLSQIPRQAVAVRRAIENITENIENLHEALGKGSIDASVKNVTADNATDSDYEDDSMSISSSESEESIDEEESVLAHYFTASMADDGEMYLEDHLDFCSKLPRDGSAIEYRGLAAKLGIHDAEYMLDIVRLATVKWGIFREPAHGWIAHNDFSLLFSVASEEQTKVKAATKGTSNTTADNNANQSSSQSNVALASPSCSGSQSGSSKLNPSPRGAPLGKSINQSPPSTAPKSSLAAIPGTGFLLLFQGFYWNTLSSGRLVVVLSHTRDNLAIHLAHRHKQLRFINLVASNAPRDPHLASGSVENLETMVLAPGIRWSGAADVILLRRVLHNYTDQECVMAFRRMISYLRPGDLILINDVALGSTGYEVAANLQGTGKKRDKKQVTFESARPELNERTVQHWMRLLATADERFYFSSFTKAAQDEGMSLMTIAWTG